MYHAFEIALDDAETPIGKTHETIGDALTACFADVPATAEVVIRETSTDAAIVASASWPRTERPRPYGCNVRHYVVRLT